MASKHNNAHEPHVIRFAQKTKQLERCASCRASGLTITGAETHIHEDVQHPAVQQNGRQQPPDLPFLNERQVFGAQHDERLDVQGSQRQQKQCKGTNDNRSSGTGRTIADEVQGNARRQRGWKGANGNICSAGKRTSTEEAGTIRYDT